MSFSGTYGDLEQPDIRELQPVPLAAVDPRAPVLKPGYDAAVSKELVPVEFSRGGVRVTLPELEIVEEERTSVSSTPQFQPPTVEIIGS